MVQYDYHFSTLKAPGLFKWCIYSSNVPLHDDVADEQKLFYYTRRGAYQSGSDTRNE